MKANGTITSNMGKERNIAEMTLSIRGIMTQGKSPGEVSSIGSMDLSIRGIFGMMR
jgi:hypothetical protein